MATQALEGVHTRSKPQPDRWHRVRVRLITIAEVALVFVIAFYGFSYYRLPLAERVNSPLHVVLRPSGSIGLRLGQAGLVLFVFVYLYAIRKRWPWLKKFGNSRHWLDLHMLMGVGAPLLITFHSSFKLRGLAGVAFWIMWSVVASGVVGRYFYGQIPRSLSTAELSLKEMENARALMSQRLAQQRLFAAADMAPLFRVPAPEQVQRMSIFRALILMIALDCIRPFQVSRLRRKSMGTSETIWTLGGLLRSSHRELEEVISTIRRQSWLLMKMNFLGKAQTVFHLWHIVHRPFSYSLVVLTVVHIATVLLLGYY